VSSPSKQAAICPAVDGDGFLAYRISRKRKLSSSKSGDGAASAHARLLTVMYLSPAFQQMCRPVFKPADSNRRLEKSFEGRSRQ
jgi:hypothetical protein